MAKVLVVEDNEGIRRLIRFTLADLGHEISEATDGEEALRTILHPEPGPEPDLVILDVMIPRLDGWEVLHRLRRAGKRNVRVVLLTAKAAETDFVMGWRLGVDEYMTKPFDPDHLVRAVNETLRMTPEEIRQKRLRELEKANLLLKIESAFGEW